MCLRVHGLSYRGKRSGSMPCRTMDTILNLPMDEYSHGMNLNFGSPLPVCMVDDSGTRLAMLTTDGFTAYTHCNIDWAPKHTGAFDCSCDILLLLLAPQSDERVPQSKPEGFG